MNFLITCDSATERAFSADIKKFNGIYKLPVSALPTLDIGTSVIQRLKDFKNILQDELNEVDEIIQKLEHRDSVAGMDLTEFAASRVPTKLEVLTMLADWLGDIQVYCASEMAKFGLPIDGILGIIMQSNFSKLGADGLPIYDERGKVMKGPNYWKPEPQIKQLLETLLNTEKPQPSCCGSCETCAGDDKAAPDSNFSLPA